MKPYVTALQSGEFRQVVLPAKRLEGLKVFPTTYYRYQESPGKDPPNYPASASKLEPMSVFNRQMRRIGQVDGETVSR